MDVDATSSSNGEKDADESAVSAALLLVEDEMAADSVIDASSSLVLRVAAQALREEDTFVLLSF